MTRAQRIVRGHAESEAAVDDAELLDHIDVVDVRKMRAAILVGNRHAEHSELARFAEDVSRKMLRLVPLHQVRLDLALGELAHHLLDLLLLFGQAEVHASGSFLSACKGRDSNAIMSNY